MLACLDELPSTAPLRTLRTRMADERALGISFIWAAQTRRQLSTIFGDQEDRTLLGLTNNLILFGGSKEVAFNQEISDLVAVIATNVDELRWRWAATRSRNGTVIPFLRFVDRMRQRIKDHCEDGHQPWPAKGPTRVSWANGPRPNVRMLRPRCRTRQPVAGQKRKHAVTAPGRPRRDHRRWHRRDHRLLAASSLGLWKRREPLSSFSRLVSQRPSAGGAGQSEIGVRALAERS